MAEFETALGDTATTRAPDADTLLTPLSGGRTTPRALLVRKLTDIVVLPAGRISSNERSLAADILLQVLDKVDEEMRIDVARRAARVSEIPLALIRALLLDEPAVAEQIVTQSDSLPEALLIEAAQDGAPAHRLMIARRTDLSAAVADACLHYDELEVCKLALRRDETVLSPNAVNRLVALSATHEALQLPLIKRRELEPAHGFMMFWWLNAERRRRILARFSMDRSTIQDALSDLYPRIFRGNENDPFVKEILILAERRHRPRGMNGEPVSMDVVLRTLAASRGYPAQEIIDAVGMVAGVSRELTARVLRDPGGEPFAVLCKSLGIPRDAFFSFFEKDEDGGAKGEELLALFDSMARDYARAVLRYWDWDGNPRIAHITRLLGLLEDDIDSSSAF